MLVVLAAASAHDDADNDLTSLDRVIGGVERTRYGVPHIPSWRNNLVYYHSLPGCWYWQLIHQPCTRERDRSMRQTASTSNKLHTEEVYSRAQVGGRARYCGTASRYAIDKESYIDSYSATCTEYYRGITADTKEKRNFIENARALKSRYVRNELSEYYLCNRIDFLSTAGGCHLYF